MSDEGWLWGEAEVTYPDWVGTAQLDKRMTGPQLEEIVGLDRTEWMVIGIDIGGGETRHSLDVVAIHRDFIDEGGHVLPRIAAANGGEIPATHFKIHDVDPYAVLQAVSHMFELRLRVRSCADIPIRIMTLSDVPEQFMQE